MARSNSTMFKDANGKTSVNRIGFFILILQAVFQSTYMLLADKAITDIVILFTTIMTAATTLKLSQNSQENNNIKNKANERD